MELVAKKLGFDESEIVEARGLAGRVALMWKSEIQERTFW